MFLLSQLRISDLPGVEADAACPPTAGALSCCVMVNNQSVFSLFTWRSSRPPPMRAIPETIRTVPSHHRTESSSPKRRYPKMA